MLLEFCAAYDLCLANIFFERDNEELLTYRDFGVAPLAGCSYPDFAQLDYMVIPQDQMQRVIDVRSIRSR